MVRLALVVITILVGLYRFSSLRRTNRAIRDKFPHTASHDGYRQSPRDKAYATVVGFANTQAGSELASLPPIAACAHPLFASDVSLLIFGCRLRAMALQSQLEMSANIGGICGFRLSFIFTFWPGMLSVCVFIELVRHLLKSMRAGSGTSVQNLSLECGSSQIGPLRQHFAKIARASSNVHLCQSSSSWWPYHAAPS
jgi:hypothetical protein